MLQRSVQFSVRELSSETISCIFAWGLYQNNQGLSWSLYKGDDREADRRANYWLKQIIQNIQSSNCVIQRNQQGTFRMSFSKKDPTKYTRIYTLIHIYIYKIYHIQYLQYTYIRKTDPLSRNISPLDLPMYGNYWIGRHHLASLIKLSMTPKSSSRIPYCRHSEERQNIGWRFEALQPRYAYILH